MKVLIIDDSRLVRHVIKDSLSSIPDVEIFESDKGSEGIEIAVREQPNVIVCDIEMPDTQGYEVGSYLKNHEKTKLIPILFITGGINTEEELLEFGDGFLSKPFTKSKILSNVLTLSNINRLSLELQKKNSILQSLNKQKNELLGLASHDLKNPINQIRGFAQLVQLSPEIQKLSENEYINEIIKACDRMVEIIDNFLDVSAIEQGIIRMTIEPHSIKTLIEHSIKAFTFQANNKEIKIINNINNMELPYVLIDRDKTLEVLDNIISNAIKYSPLNTNISIDSKTDDDYVSIHITDEGLGFSSEELKEVFITARKFSSKPTANEKSTGLGLTIVKKLIEKQNGKLGVSSDGKNKGSTFSFSLPIAK